MKKNLFYLCIILFFGSCASGKIKTTDTKTDEVFIFGKLSINEEEARSYEKVFLYFNTPDGLDSEAKKIRVDSTGFFSKKLPKGEYFISVLGYGKKTKKIAKGYIVINTMETTNCLYIGDIFIDWKPTFRNNQYLATAAGGVIGYAFIAYEDGEALPAKVINSDTTIQYFKGQYPSNTKEIETQLAVINETKKKEKQSDHKRSVRDRRGVK
ncbi:hypothetical protein [Dysgonomonas sp. 25]|uniref:hypothetical protein n=1 Tax=Dysgonomonas sp. 25 TaxID=2302933 RepID=UPI0013D65161|nr:hypothetical protein [Dysgonomonas sp. 25]NDV69713.1 hypothetical protein [Dysgonomonas sp. 25]